MKTVLIALVLVFCADHAQAQRAIYIVRHAEKVDESRDPPLSEAGKTRATALRDVLRDARITHVYVTQYRRTRDTAQALLDSARLEPVSLPAGDTPSLVRRLRAHGPDDAVLVVGHSDTLPGLVAALSGAPPPTLAHGDYDNLFVVVPGKPVLRLHYGAITLAPAR